MLHHIGTHIYIFIFMFSFVWKTHMCVFHIGIYVRTVVKSPNSRMTFMLIFFYFTSEGIKKKQG